MSLDREAIAVALEQRLRSYLEVPLITRSPSAFRNASAAQQPAVLLLCGPEDAERTRGLPPKWTLQPAIHVYVRNGSGTPAPDTRLNELATAIESAFEQQPGEAAPERWLTTLDGLVARCWVTAMERVPGEAQHEAELRVDLEIVAVAR